MFIITAVWTIQPFCTSVHHSQHNAVSLYENLRAFLKHFAHSVKSMETLNDACNILNRDSVHILNWGCAGIDDFLDACVWSLGIIVPFLDTLVNCKIQQDETKFIGRRKGFYLLQLFADLHPVFANRYLYQVDSDDVLICEVHSVAYETASLVLDESLCTPLADALYNSLSSLLSSTSKEINTASSLTQESQEAVTF